MADRTDRQFSQEGASSELTAKHGWSKRRSGSRSTQCVDGEPQPQTSSPRQRAGSLREVIPASGYDDLHAEDGRKSRSISHKSHGQGHSKDKRTSHPTQFPQKKNSHGSDSYFELRSVRPKTSEQKRVDDSGVAFSNLAFRDVSDDDDDDDDDATTDREMEDAIVETARNTKLGAESVNDWLDYQNEIEENCANVHTRIDEMRQRLVEMVNTHAQLLHDDVNSISAVYVNKAEGAINDLDEIMQRMQRQLEEKVDHENEAQTNSSRLKTRHTLETLNRDFEALDDEPPPWQPIELKSLEDSPKIISRLLGCLKGGPSDLGWANGLDTSASKPQILTVPIRKGSFMAHSPKDQRECGIVDIAITEDKRVLIVDKHNRLVKVFDFHGNFEGCLGRDQLKDPSRVLVLETLGNVLVTDNSSRSVKLFHRDGQYICDFVKELKQPAGLCQLPDGNIAVVEYVSKSVIVYDQSGKQLQAFGTATSCPAFVSCTVDSNVLISDWKLNVIKMFDVTGCEVLEVKGQRSAEGQVSAFKEPQGIYGDVHGYVVVVDKRNNRVVVLDKEGDFECCYGEPDCKFKLPMAGACSRHGLLVVAEYQGCVKLLQYLDVEASLPLAPSGEKKQEPGRNRSADSVVVPEDVRLEPKSEKETAC